MIAVITGDIIGSQKASPRLWLSSLKKELNAIGESPRYWEIYRGDSFQLLVTSPREVLRVAIKIKASLKCIPEIDARMAIGLGDYAHREPRVTESNGTAFVHSGELFEKLKSEKQNLAIRSPWPEFDREMNLLLKLSLIVMDHWTMNAAEVVKTTMENPGKVQEELGQIVGIRQNAISNRLKRAYYDEIMEVNELYIHTLASLQ